MLRRQFLGTAALGAPLVGTAAGSGKAPFRVIFSNDLTNILTCVSPYHQKRAPLTTEMIQATVDEVPGVDVHMLQPGLCWVPWWKSKRYSTREHYDYVKQRSGTPPDAIGQYVLDGHDIVDIFIERCRLRKQVPFISFRLNDGHMLEYAGQRVPRSGYVIRFYDEHPEYRLGKDPTKWEQRVHNWGIPEAREYKFQSIREICENYDLDGFELDFMRFPAYFRQNETTSAGRARIMTEFVARVRKLLDATARNGRHRWLCARVPSFLKLHDELGIHLPSMAEAGLEMVDVSSYYFTCQQTDLAEIRKLVPKAAVYLEMTHSTWNGPAIPGVYDSFPFLRTTEHEFHTAANLAYARGASGVTLFNFVYYREHGTAGRGPFNEPPFGVLKRLGDRKWLARQPQWYVLAKVWKQPQMPRTFKPGVTHTFKLDMAPAGKRDGLLRVRALKDISNCRWTVKVNGAALKTAPYVEKPLPHPYQAALGTAAEFACFQCPRKLLRNGINEVAVTLHEGGPAVVELLDLVLP